MANGPKVRPSDAVAVIAQLFPSVTDGRAFSLGYGHENQLAGILEVIARVPPELLRLPSERLAEYFVSLGRLRNGIEIWRVRGSGGPTIAGIAGRPNPLTILYEALRDCPDEVVEARSADLAFVDDDQLRASLLADIGVTERAIGHAEWKPATILAGSVIESILLWAIRTHRADGVAEALGRVDWDAARIARPAADPGRWNLAQYVRVGEALAEITADSFRQADLAREYRNLIHPGVAERTAQECNRATAYHAFAAMLNVIRDVGRRRAGGH